MKYVVDALFYIAIIAALYFMPPAIYNAMQIAFFGG